MTATSEKIVYAFNQVLLGLIKDLRKNAALSKVVGKSFRIFDRESDAYLAHFSSHVPALTAALPVGDGGAFTYASCCAAVRELDPVRGVTLDAIYQNFTTDRDRDIVDKYILTLLSIAVLTKDMSDDAMMGVLLEKLKGIEQDGGADVSDVLDDELRNILEILAGKSAGVAGVTPVTEMMDDQDEKADEFFARVTNSKIGEIAKELAKNVNTDEGAFNPGNLGGMIKTVTETIQSKISDGSLNTEELFSEAVDMMKYFGKGNEGLFKNVNKSAMHNMDRRLKTKARLREKLTKKP